MGFLLTRLSIVAVLTLLTGHRAAADITDRHELKVILESVAADPDSRLGAWPDAGFGKLRYDARSGDPASTRIALAYSIQMTPTLFGHLVADATDEQDFDVGATETYLEWRPLPKGPVRQRLRAGAFYPGFSIENGDSMWDSPYALSFSAINAWIGEEIRPIGLEWKAGRNIGPHELGASAGIFYGNDPAGTLLFWRGWSLHARQTRLNERLPLPPLVFPDSTVVERELDPIAEIDDDPGIYAGTEWRYRRRVGLSLSFYDNRADPYAFRDGQWAWGTRFWNLTARVALPGDIALLAQSMRGDTDWLSNPTRDGSTSPSMEYVTDRFGSEFVLLSKTVGQDHRFSARFDRFDMNRVGGLNVDHGRAKSIAYTYALRTDLDLELEWLEIASSRDLWPAFYGLPAKHKESMLSLGLRLVLFDSMR